MKLLFIDHYHAPHLGGGEEYLLTAAAGLKDRGLDVHLLALPGSSLSRASQEKGMSTIEAPFFTRNVFRDARTIRSVINDVKPDIINTHGFYSGIAGRLAAKGLKNVRVVCTVHTEPKPVNAGLSYRIRGLVERATSGGIYYIAVSEAIKNQLVSLGISRERITVIHPALTTKAEPPGSRTATEVFVFGAAGRLEKVKGFDILIRAFSLIADRCSHARLHIYGEGTLRQSLERLVEQLGMSGRVFLPGYVPVEKLYRDMTVFVSSSVAEGFSITLLNAAGLGIPCICTSAGGQVEIIEHRKTGLVVPPGDPYALADAMLFACTNYPAVLELAAQAKKLTATRFTPENLVSKHENLFSRLIQVQP